MKPNGQSRTAKGINRAATAAAIRAALRPSELTPKVSTGMFQTWLYHKSLQLIVTMINTYAIRLAHGDTLMILLAGLHHADASSQQFPTFFMHAVRVDCLSASPAVVFCGSVLGTLLFFSKHQQTSTNMIFQAMSSVFRFTLVHIPYALKHTVTIPGLFASRGFSAWV